MPRSLTLASLAAVFMLGLASGLARAAAPSSEEVAAAAERFGLTCDATEDVGGASTHLDCRREIEGGASNIDLSVTYNVIGTDGLFNHATAATYGEPAPDWLDLATDVALLFCSEDPGALRVVIESSAPETELAACTIRTSAEGMISTMDVMPSAPSVPAAPPSTSDWSRAGISTYTGTWTVDLYESDRPIPFPQYAVGDTEPGSVTVDCPAEGDTCFVEFDRGGTVRLSGHRTLKGGGELDASTEAPAGTCGPSAVSRSFDSVSFGPDGATAVDETTHDPQSCEEDGQTILQFDIRWTFEGQLTSFQPAEADAAEPAGALEDYLTAYGLACADDGKVTDCSMTLPDGAAYLSSTSRNDAGEIVGIVAEVRSTDEAFPSDGISFLLGVAERTPVDDPGALLAWINQALTAGGSADGYVDGDWTAAWTDVAGGVGRTVSLELIREGAAAEPDAPAPPVEPTGRAAPVDGAGGPFAESVPTIGEVSTDPAVLLQSAALAALIVFLMPFPSQLFNSTLEAHENEVKRWVRLDRLGPVAGGIGAFWASWPGVVLFTLLAALLFSFLDPTFGLDVSSAATLIGMLAGIVLVTAAFAVPAVLAHRRIGDSPALKVVPISLLIGVACVLVSRVTDFQPGYLYGLLIGIVFARELSAADEGRATALGACLMLAVALVSWLALGVLPDGDGFGLVVARMSLAALMVAGLEGVVFGLLPMRFLPGEPLYAWNRLLWGALLAIGAFAFFHVLINPSSGYLSDTSRTPLFTVVALLVGFSLISVAFWAWFRFRDQPPVEEQTAA